ncbi:hypothetical protein WJ60_26660 [Burkholderia ubonensis]|nr:hypothetical protein WJ60_26660 [Burkholderia ubonensis]
MSGFTVGLAAVDGGQNPRFSGGDYAGTLMTDGWPAWRTVKTATHLGCLAQARRLFTDALKGQKNKPSPRVTKAPEFFQALYQVEALAKQTLPEGETLTDYRYRLRQQHSVPLLTAFKAWLDELASKVLPQSLLGEAIGYCRRQWQYLIRYVDDGRLPLDNNVIERDIRPFATARKSWLFSDTVAGAKASALRPSRWRALQRPRRGHRRSIPAIAMRQCSPVSCKWLSIRCTQFTAYGASAVQRVTN